MSMVRVKFYTDHYKSWPMRSVFCCPKSQMDGGEVVPLYPLGSRTAKSNTTIHLKHYSNSLVQLLFSIIRFRVAPNREISEPFVQAITFERK